ncbi:uncharacterized protein LOC110851410 [Folsomia candida]|uniref:Uncharacterized protein n=1 Tax=Folsomia candida TaxID=158441 RepID=A0A226E6J0_FOLCA|nr:uncharacterized protein LOC110851410 [Folsomia candida]OXA53232.1 hypothetical protein Fcan01_12516 [Folsomia candida]
MNLSAVITSIVILFCLAVCEGRLSTRCYVCRSRGELGDCKDPFSFNDTSIKDLPGFPVSVTPCPSGWCRKQTEGIRGPADEYGSATDRSCLSQAPNDGEERCAEVKIRNKVSRLCLCRGDLCNMAPSSRHGPLFLVAFLTMVTISINYY